MSKSLVGCVAGIIVSAASLSAWGQDPAGSQPAAAATPAPSATASISAASDDTPRFEPYAPGFPPENNLLELGVWGGALFPSHQHNLLREPGLREHYDV